METQRGSLPTYLVVMILVMGAFGVMGGGLVAPALPTIGGAFDVPEGQQGLVLSVYTLAAAISLPFIGYLIDVIGRRKVGIACLLIDGAVGVAIIFAPTFTMVLGLRFLQGIGIAGLIPVAMTIIGDLYTGERRLQVMGYLTGVISLGAVVIPTLGGALASIDWRLVFLVYGFCLFLALFFFIALPETSPSVGRSLRQTGADHESGQSSHSAKEYLLSLFSVLKNRDIRNIMFQALVHYFFLYTLVTFLPIYLALIHGFGEIYSGIALSLQGVFSALIASRAQFVAHYLQWWQRIALGFVMKGCAFLLLPLWPEGSLLIVVSIVIYGLGFGIVSPTIYNRATKLPPKELIGSVVAIFNTMKYIGMTLSPFILGVVLNFTDLQVVFAIVAAVSIIWGGLAFRLAKSGQVYPEDLS